MSEMLSAAALDALPPLLREGVMRWWERAVGQAELLAAFGTLDAARRGELLRVVAASEFVAAALIQDPRALGWLIRHDDPAAARDGGEHYARSVREALDEVEAQRVLREWRRRVQAHIVWRDLAGRAGVRETLDAVSDFADAAVRVASEAARRHLQALFGTPRDESGAPAAFIVLGMGKLGGRELNFSSDIDLILVYRGPGETDGPRRIDNAEYFDRLGRELIRLLDVRTTDGFVFRVDMRLRPFGDSGPLVVSSAALEDYLQQHGRDWERYAWIKARPLVGEEAYAALYAECVRPFVFRRYLDFGVFESLRDMKSLIEREVSRRELEGHLKLGRGGIREVEFIVQSLQLVRGGSDRRLQSAQLLKVLPLLADSKLLEPANIAALTDAYLLLRNAENALQMIRDEQTHTLPESEVDQARMALYLGAAAWPQVAARIEAARGGVARQFSALLFGAPDEAKGLAEPMFSWLDTERDQRLVELARRAYAVPLARELDAALQAFCDAATFRRLDASGKKRLQLILDRLLSRAGGCDDPLSVVQRVLRVLESIGSRASYLALLKEQPAALDRLIEVCAISGFLSRQIADFPLLLDELIDAKAFNELPSRAGFQLQLQARIEQLPADDPERQVEGLRQFQKAAVFNVALADLTARLPLMRVSDRLTDIAELILQCCMDLGWQQMTALYGVPHCGEEGGALRPVNIAVAGYGKLGGLELGYGSDLDLVFLHDSHGAVQATVGERPTDNGLFFLRLGQRIVHLLTMHSSAGRLYEVDMRLRPNGKGGFLITGIDAFERYQQSEAWTWEHQALLRARAVAGAPGLCAEFEAARRRTLVQAVKRDTLRSDVAEMRVRMRKELSQAGAGQFDIKQGAGGIADIEFLVQYWVLRDALAHPQLLTYSDNIRQLEGLAHVGALSSERAHWLTETYIGYRTVLHHLSLEAGGERVVDEAPFVVTRDAVKDIWRETFG
jgi:glutamate-ammonia-ligase adenylyltransferase